MQTDPRALIESYERSLLQRLSETVDSAGDALEARPESLRDSVRTHPVLWLAGGAVAGFTATLVVKRLGFTAATTGAMALFSKLARLSAMTRTTSRFTSWATGGADDPGQGL